MFYANPILIIQICGEVVYIMDQRLLAQKTEESKAQKVINDILYSLFCREIFSQIFQSKITFSIPFLKSFIIIRALFHKIIHSSIVKLNQVSFNKMLDLIFMSIKLNTILSMHPCQLYQITLNYIHQMNTILKGSSQKILKQVEDKFKSIYSKLSPLKYMQVKEQILNLLQKKNCKVATLLRLNYQLKDQTLIVYNRIGCSFASTPGLIINYITQQQKLLPLKIADQFQTKQQDDNFQNWLSELGLNLYNGQFPFQSGRLGLKIAKNEIKLLSINKKQEGLKSLIRGKDSKVDKQLKFNMFQDGSVIKEQHANFQFIINNNQKDKLLNAFDDIDAQIKTTQQYKQNNINDMMDQFGL